MKMTNLERQAVKGIIDSDYQDGENQSLEQGFSWHPVWSWSANPGGETFGGTAGGRRFGAVIGSLVKKGFAEASGDGNEATITLTEEGFKIYYGA